MKTETENLRELDAWIADHVMGWTRVIFNEKWNRGLGAWQGQNPERPVSGSSHLDTNIPEYTTDPAAAMQVLEKCAEKCITVQIVKQSDGGWYLTCDTEHVPTFGETLSIAICKLAKALYSK